jgi:glycine/D-amino acid oxidase-like deaminating enzyme
LLIAVNAYGTSGPADLRPDHTPLHYFQVATPPLPSHVLTTILPERHGAWDTATVMSSFRLDRDGRLVLGGIGSFDGFGATTHRSWAARKLRALFPQLGTPPFEHAWFGRIAMTSDRLPRIERIGPDAFSIFGYNGRGIAPGTVMGKAFADYVASGDESAFPLAPVDRNRSAFAGTAGLIYEMGATAFHLVNAR